MKIQKRGVTMSNSVDEDAKDAKPIVEADREAPESKCPFHAGKPPQSNQAPGGGTTNRAAFV